VATQRQRGAELVGEALREEDRPRIRELFLGSPFVVLLTVTTDGASPPSSESRFTSSRRFSRANSRRASCVDRPSPTELVIARETGPHEFMQ
jgi:hypothetical protein